MADVRLRTDTAPQPLAPPPPESRHALRIFLGAAILLAVAGVSTFYYLRSGGAGSARPTPATATPAPVATAVTEPTSVPAAPTAAPEPTPSAVPPVATGPVAVTFESNTNAQLTVDGKSYRGLPAPVKVALKPGRYKAVFEVPNYQRKEETFEIRAGMPPSSIRVNFDPWGLLEITSDPLGADVRIEGKSFGTTPVKRPFRVGAHAVEVSLPGYEPQRQTVEVRELDLAKALFRLKKSS